ncbi:MAG: hypothetical protein WKF94_16295 [Solirubrobacteraceae bacterium]
MTRTTILMLIAAAIVGTAIASGFVLTGSSEDNSTQKPQAGRSPSDERAPEAEDHSGAVELRTVERAARGFLASYLPLVYGKEGASADALRNAAPRLIARLKSEGARVTPAQSQTTPRLTRVTAIGDGPMRALVTAQITESRTFSYPLTFHLEDTSTGWVVTRIGGS